MEFMKSGKIKIDKINKKIIIGHVHCDELNIMFGKCRLGAYLSDGFHFCPVTYDQTRSSAIISGLDQANIFLNTSLDETDYKQISSYLNSLGGYGINGKFIGDRLVVSIMAKGKIANKSYSSFSESFKSLKDIAKNENVEMTK